MKHLKPYKIFESNKDLTKEDINDMLIDISDMGYRVISNISTRVQHVESENEEFFGRLNLVEIPYAYIYIKSVNKDDGIETLVNTPEFYEIYEEFNTRLDEFGWYISDMTLWIPSQKEYRILVNKENFQRQFFSGIESGGRVGCSKPEIRIFLHKKEDSKYVK